MSEIRTVHTLKSWQTYRLMHSITGTGSPISWNSIRCGRRRWTPPELNRRFFKEIADWYFWAVDKVTFPPDAGADETVRNATCIIRLITRLIFVWFLKEKDLVPNTSLTKMTLRNCLQTSMHKRAHTTKRFSKTCFLPR